MRKEYDIYLVWGRTKDRDVFARVKEEFLFRLNPHWIINSFSYSEESYLAEIKDHETDQASVLKGNYTLDPDGFPRITAQHSDWDSIRFFEKNGNLHAEVSYVEDPPEEVERQVVLWLRSVKEYLRLYTSNSINARFFRIIMNRIILQMTPSQRKISLMLIRITILELLVIVLILVGWFFFIR